jgi:hypothetical protein
VQLTVPLRGGWRAWAGVRGGFERALADPSGFAIATAGLASEHRRGADYVRVTVGWRSMPVTLLTRWRWRGTLSPVPRRTTLMARMSPLPWPRCGPGRLSPASASALSEAAGPRTTGITSNASFLGEGNARSGVVAGAALADHCDRFPSIELPFLHIGLSVQHAFGEPGGPGEPSGKHLYSGRRCGDDVPKTGSSTLTHQITEGTAYTWRRRYRPC